MKERISLGIKQLEDDPFNNFVAVNKKGAVVSATVVAGMFALINYRIKMLTLGKVAVAVVDDDEEDI